METYEKYEGKYREGLSRSNGKDFITGSIEQLIRDGKYYGFTRDNNARKNLEDNVSVTDAKRIVIGKMGMNYNSEISSQKLSEAIENYIETFLSNIESKRR